MSLAHYKLRDHHIYMIPTFFKGYFIKSLGVINAPKDEFREKK